MSAAEPLTAKGAATRARLLEVAAALFAEKGYSATSFAELINASGLTKGAFYFYFKSKADLALAVIDDQQERWVSYVQDRVTAHPTPATQLADVLPAVLDLLAREPAAWSMIRLARELGGDPTLGRDVVKPVASWIELLAGIIRAGQEAGELRPDLEPDEVAVVLVGAFDGIKTLVDATATTPENRTSLLERHTRTFGDVAVPGLLANQKD